MSQADGTILIDTEINADGMKAGSKEVEAAVRRMANSVNDLGTKARTALNKQVDSFSKLNKEYAAQAQKVDELKKKVAEYGAQKIPTKEFEKLGKDMDSASSSAEKLRKKIAELNSKKETILSSPINSKDIQKYSQQLETIRKKSNEVYEEAEKTFSEKYKDVLPFSSDTAINSLKANDENYQKSVSYLSELGEKSEQLEDALLRATNAQEKINSDSISKIDQDIESANQELSEFESRINSIAKKLNAMEDGGTAFNTEKLKKAESQLEKESNRLSDMNNRLGTSYSSIKGQVNDYNNSLIKNSSAQNKSAKSMSNTGKAAKSAHYGLRNMLGTGLLMGFAFQAVYAAISALQDGFSNLSQYSSSTNNSISMLWSSLERLKNSLATAFAPILDVVAPILSRFIDMLSTAASYVSMFFAFLSGKSTYTRAVAVQKDYAASLEDTASGAQDAADATDAAAEAAEGYLSPLDEINKLDKNDTSSGGSGGSGGGGAGGGGTGPLFEEVPIDNKFASLLDSVIDKLKEIRDIFLNGFWDGLGDYKPLLNELKSDLSSIGKYLTDIFTDADVQAAAKNFIESFVYNVGRVAGSVSRVGLTLAVLIVGGIESYLSENSDRVKQYLISMFDISAESLNIFGDLAVSIADIFSSVFGSQMAQDLLGNIIGIFAEALYGAQTLALSFGRDFLNLIAQPIIENKDLIASALYETLQPIEQITQSIETFIQNLVTKILDLYNAHIKPFIDSIASGISQIVGVFLSAYNEYIAPVLDKLAAKFDEVLNGPVADALNSFLNVLGKIIDVLTLLWEEVLVPLISWIIENIIPIIAPIIEQLGTIALDLLGTIGGVASGILDALGGLIDFIVGVFTGDWSKAFSGLKSIAKGFQDALNSIFSFIENNIIKPFDKFLSGVFAVDWRNSFGILGNVINGFFDIVESVWNGVKGVFNGIVTFINGVFSGNWRKAWNGIVQILKSIWNTAVGVIKTPINGIIGAINGLIRGVVSGVNSVIRALNRIHFSIPSWVPVFGGRSFGFNLGTISAPQIPYLASGAVIPPNQEFLAVLGDQKQGNNIEAPESLIRRIVREESGNSGGNYEFIAQINRKVIFREVIEQAKLIRSQTGKNPFEMA